MLKPIVKSMLLIFAFGLALSACGVNYHFNPGANTWPPREKPPAPKG
jgi:hypothetical protein